MRIEEIKVHKLGDIMGIALGAFFGFKSSIKTMDFSLDMVDNIFLGTQVWVGKTKSTS